jgi:Queuosine biosynthesis protein QueC
MSIEGSRQQSLQRSAAARDQSLTIHLLWTGGWDSTFRLIDLVLNRKCRVQPHYVVDATRASTDYELRAMTELRDRLERRDGGVQFRLLPTHFRDLRKIPPDARIRGALESLRERTFVGIQYAYLARFARELELEDLELAVQRREEGLVGRVLQHCVTEVLTDAGPSFRVDPTTAGAAEQAMFGRFSFPLLDLTKLDMQRMGEERGVADLMDLTWFCHRPRRDGKPCGSCSPCSYAIEEGLSRRVPLRGRVRYQLSPQRRANAWLRRRPRWYARYLRVSQRLWVARSLLTRSWRRLFQRYA